MEKTIYIAGNWKSYKTDADAKTWFAAFDELVRAENIDISKVSIVLCPGYLLLPTSSQEVKSRSLSLFLGAQDVSAFGEGAFTGEVHAGQIAEFASWTIVGHSERRRMLGETDQLLFEKVKAAKNAGLRVIYCVQDEAVRVPDGVDVIAYEPPWAISAVSGGIAQNPESANRVCEKISTQHAGIPVIYGGSTNPDNIVSFISQPYISGVLPGGASMDPQKFFEMVKHAVEMS